MKCDSLALLFVIRQNLKILNTCLLIISNPTRTRGVKLDQIRSDGHAIDLIAFRAGAGLCFMVLNVFTSLALLDTSKLNSFTGFKIENKGRNDSLIIIHILNHFLIPKKVFFLVSGVFGNVSTTRSFSLYILQSHCGT